MFVVPVWGSSEEWLTSRQQLYRELMLDGSFCAGEPQHDMDVAGRRNL